MKEYSRNNDFVLIEVYYPMTMNSVSYQRIGYELMRFPNKKISYFGSNTNEQEQLKTLELMCMRLEDINQDFKKKIQTIQQS